MTLAGKVRNRAKKPGARSNVQAGFSFSFRTAALACPLIELRLFEIGQPRLCTNHRLGCSQLNCSK
jgi:hypothetical protein